MAHRIVIVFLAALLASTAYAQNIHVAARAGNIAEAEAVLKLIPTDINSTAAQYRVTPLHVAAKAGKAEMVSFLLSRGANIEAKDQYNMTPIFAAASNGHANVITILIKAGANPNAVADEKYRPIHLAIANGGANKEAAVRALVEGGANPNAVDSTGITPLATELKFWGKTPVADYLVSKGAK